MLVIIFTTIIMLVLFFNLLEIQELLSIEPTFKYIYELFKKESIAGMLLYVLFIPAILVYAIIKFFMWKPFGE